MNRKSNIICLAFVILLIAQVTLFGAEIEKATVALLPVFNDAGQEVEKLKIADLVTISINEWLKDKGCTVISEDRVKQWLTQKNINPENRWERTREVLSNLGKELETAFVLSTGIAFYTRFDGTTVVHLSCKLLNVESGEYDILGIFSGYGKQSTRFTSMNTVRAKATRNAVKMAFEAKLAPVVPPTPVGDITPSTEQMDPKRIVVLPAINVSGKEGDEEDRLCQTLAGTLATSFTDSGFTVVSDDDVRSFIAANKLNFMDDEVRTSGYLKAIGNAFHAGHVALGALLPIEDTYGMVFLWSKQRQRATIHLQLLDVQKEIAVIDGKTTDQADNVMIGNLIPTEGKRSLRERAVMRATRRSVEEFLKPYKLDK